MEGLKECKADLTVYIHPSKANSAYEAIHGELSSMLFTYNETFEGVVLAYDPKICSNLAKVLPGLHPYFGVKFKADLLLFDPKPDMILEGEVVKITPHSIHAVVLGFSSAFISDEHIRDEFKHKLKQGEEAYVSRSHKKHKIKVGTVIRFKVKSFDEEILHISGSLEADNSGSARWLDRNLHEWSQGGDSTVKSIKKDEEDEKQQGGNLVVKRERVSLEDEVQVKKAKKRRKEHS